MHIKKIGILTSGGDAPGMNAAIRAIVRTSFYYNITPYGISNGYRGLLNNEFIKLQRSSVSNILSKGGTILGSARLEEFKQEETRIKAKEILLKNKIDALITIGGDGTLQGAKLLSDLGVKVIFIPATIDNDVSNTDYTIGFSTALNTVVDAIDKLRDTAESHQRCSIIETMGRDKADLALYAGICGGAEFVITKDTGLNKKEIFESLREKRLQGREHAIIVISEKITNVYDLAKEIEKETLFETRATVLGYVQRGGSPSPEDRILASRMGTFSIELLQKNIYNCIVSIKNNNILNIGFNEETDKIILNKFYELIEKIR